MPPGTTLRNIRMDDDLWAALSEKASEHGMDASKVVRWLVRAWLDDA